MTDKLRFYTAVGAMAALGLVGATGAGAEPPNYGAAEAVCSRRRRATAPVDPTWSTGCNSSRAPNA